MFRGCLCLNCGHLMMKSAPFIALGLQCVSYVGCHGKAATADVWDLCGHHGATFTGGTQQRFDRKHPCSRLIGCKAKNSCDVQQDLTTSRLGSKTVSCLHRQHFKTSYGSSKWLASELCMFFNSYNTIQ